MRIAWSQKYSLDFIDNHIYCYFEAYMKSQFLYISFGT